MYKIGYNPNLLEDIKTILNLTENLNEIKQEILELDKKSPTTYEKLIAFIDHMEFIEHLA